MNIYEAITKHLKESFLTQFTEHELIITQGNNFRTLTEGQVFCNVTFSNGTTEGGPTSMFSTLHLNTILTFKYFNNEQKDIVSRISSAVKLELTNQIKNEDIVLGYDDDSEESVNFIYNFNTPTTNGNVSNEQSSEGKTIKTSVCMLTGEVIVTTLPVQSTVKYLKYSNMFTYYLYGLTGYNRNKTWNYTELEVSSPYNQSEFESYNEVLVLTFYKVDSPYTVNTLVNSDFKGQVLSFFDGSRTFDVQILSYSENEVNGISSCTLTLKVVA